MILSPTAFLGMLTLVTAGALSLHKAMRYRRQSALRRLAAESQLRYVPGDLFDLTRRLAGQFPIGEATDLRVLDLIYGSQEDRHRYLFTTEFTLGPLDHHKRECRVATYWDPKDPAASHAACHVVLAPRGLSIVEQYRYLLRHECGAGADADS